ncbi:hypothetical protein MKW94_004444 [Papaver nudicaule]|uniref:Mitochondrial intermembrane space import and assembly protein 40 homolog n=1 Tax=Papaver nudicaule TaxID=74823 RepID=A0AA42B2P7_PAPNU|nr:hypothetical protein [Papaver nudicaule]
MGQVQSNESDVNQNRAEEETGSSNGSSSLGDLIAEATAYGNDENESLEAKAQKALECPCVAELRSGPCGTSFSEAFLCFLKSTAEEKGSDCVNPFIALQDCIKANPNAFSKDVLDEDDNSKEEEEQIEDHRIIPPTWAKEQQSRL